MNTSINKDWLWEHGVEGDEATLEDVAHHAEEALELLVGRAITEELTDEELKELEQLMENNVSESKRLQWLEKHCPQYEEITKQVTADFKKDIISSKYPITFILEQQSGG